MDLTLFLLICNHLLGCPKRGARGHPNVDGEEGYGQCRYLLLNFMLVVVLVVHLLLRLTSTAFLSESSRSGETARKTRDWMWMNLNLSDGLVMAFSFPS